MGYVYKITNTVNQKHYIGISIHEPETGRIKKHLSGRGSRILANAVKKYGRDAFIYEILEENVFPTFLPDLEVAYIKKFNTVTPNGYNLTYGGEGGSLSEETRRKISEAQKGKKRCKLSEETCHKISIAKTGYKHTEETRRKMSESRKGRKPSAETREKMSRAHRGKSFSNETRKKLSLAHNGKHLSSKTREKISRAKRGKPLSEEHREKISRAKRGRPGNHKGKSHSEETREKISRAQRGRVHSKETREKISRAHRGRASWNKGKPAYNRSPFFTPAYNLFFSLPSDMNISEKRKLLREKFPDVNHNLIGCWVRKWQSES